MKKFSKMIALILACALLLALSLPVFAEEETVTTAAPAESVVAENAETEEETGNGVLSSKAWAAAVVLGVVAAAGAVGMAVAIANATGSMARQPEAAGRINSAMMLGLVFIETAIIYALIVAILIIFVL